MKAIWGVLLVCAATLALLAGVVFGLGDSSVFVPPPEAVVEGFMRELATKRYERALPYLTEDLAARTDADALKSLTARLKSRTGDILDVRGEPGWIDGDRAEASVTLKTKHAGQPALRFTLTRQEGAWSIDNLQSLADNTRP